MKNKEGEWSGKSRGGSFGYNFFIFLIRKIGIRFAYAFLSLVVVYFIPFAPKASKSIWQYNRKRLAYGRFKSFVKLYVHYYVFGQTIIDKIAISNGLAHKYSFEFENHEQLKEILNKGATTIIGAHVGCWEVASGFFGDYAHRLNIVMYDGEYQKIKEALKSSGAKYKIIAVNEGGIESLLRIKQAIEAEEYVCFQGDRYIKGSSTCKLNFMGKEAFFPQGPFLIAEKFKTPIVTYFAMRERGMKYKLKFTIIEPGFSQEEILEKYVNILEDVVRQYPQQWFNFYDLWQLEKA